MGAEKQIRWNGQAHRDELGLAFGEGFPLVATLELDGVILTNEAKVALEEINRRVDMMSGHENAELWTEAAIRSDPHWAELRLLARDALALLHRR